MAIVDLLIGGALTLIGGAAGTTLQAHYQRKQQRDQHNERRRELRREKAEKVLAELRDLVSNYSDQALWAMQRANKPEENIDSPPAPSVAMLEGLVSIYFPECRGILQKFDDDMKGIVEKYAKEFRSKIETGHGLDIRGIHILMTQESSYRANSLSEELRKAMDIEIDKLW